MDLQAEHGVPVPQRSVDMVKLVVSELVTNTRKYAPGPSLLTLEARDGAAEVTVWDTEPRLPAIQDSDPERVGQHGLEIVTAVCRSFEVHREPVGKRITATIDLADDPSEMRSAASDDQAPLGRLASAVGGTQGEWSTVRLTSRGLHPSPAEPAGIGRAPRSCPHDEGRCHRTSLVARARKADDGLCRCGRWLTRLPCKACSMTCARRCPCRVRHRVGRHGRSDGAADSPGAGCGSRGMDADG
ncbi:ATP-binding protein [Streptomyces barringtoniae]|uniref:ATP-binding protein n=1 Tax=Streptomyces barringtoniae TaxID=2892029 RepID=UPI003557C7AB